MPSARIVPISRVRSRTLMSMAFTTPTPAAAKRKPDSMTSAAWLAWMIAQEKRPASV